MRGSKTEDKGDHAFDDPASFSEAVWPREALAPTRTLACRHCGQKNRVQVPAAVVFPERHECGACGCALFLANDEPLVALSSTAYEHSLDRKSLAALKAIPGFTELVRWTLTRVGDRAARITLTANAVQCGDEQFPELLELMDLARARLDIPFRPTVFLGESPHMNAMATGLGDPMITVNSGLLDQLADDEVVAVFGHELGHLHPGHQLFHELAQLLLIGGATALGFAATLGWPLRAALFKWQRCSELTADRAALLACRNLRTTIGLLLKFAGGYRPGTKSRTSIRLGPFIRQARELARQQSGDALSGAIAAWISMDRKHPFVTWRVMHLIKWAEHGRYLDIIAGQYTRRLAGEDQRAPGYNGEDPGTQRTSQARVHADG
ncbi:MAG: M48 family metallopeptidase [Polyangiaceae bacterium]|jgi:Zn-dependent protease with chaperone function|nr:M48 family metallopeptidase [Polyangiaceae bacterium]